MKNILVAAVTILLSLVSAIKQAVLFSLIPIQPRFLVIWNRQPPRELHKLAHVLYPWTLIIRFQIGSDIKET